MSKREIQTLINEAPSSWKKMFKRYRLGAKPTVDQLIDVVLDYTPSMRSSGAEGKAKYRPPAKVRKEAMEGIRLSWENNYTSASGIGLVRAMQLVVEPKIWERSVKRMQSYFARSKKDTPKRYMAWLNWGGDSGKKWVDGLTVSNPRRRRNSRPTVFPIQNATTKDKLGLNALQLGDLTRKEQGLITQVQQAIITSLPSECRQSAARERMYAVKQQSQPLFGRCSLAAQTLWVLLGGFDGGYAPLVIPRGKNPDTHWFVIRMQDGVILDPTAIQFGADPIPYGDGVLNIGLLSQHLRKKDGTSQLFKERGIWTPPKSTRALLSVIQGVNPRRRRNNSLPPKLIGYHCGKRKPSDAWNAVRFLGRGENFGGGRVMPPLGWGIYFATARQDYGGIDPRYGADPHAMTNQEYYDSFYAWRKTTEEKMSAPYCKYAPLPYLSIVEIDTSGLMGRFGFPSEAIGKKYEALLKKHSARYLENLFSRLGIEETHKALKKIGITGKIGGAGVSFEIAVFDPSIITDISVEPMFDQAYADEYAEQQRLADQRWAVRKAEREARRAARRAKYTQNPRRRRNGTRLVPKEQVRMVGFTKAKTKKVTPHIPVVLGFIEELLGEEILFPTPIRPMTKAEFQEGRCVVDNGHPRGAGHGQYDAHLKEVAVNGKMEPPDIVANILHENLHHARPDWTEERVRDTTGQGMEYLYGFYNLGKPFADGRLKANPRRNRSIPARYLTGYKGAERKKRVAEIEQRRAEYKEALVQYEDESSFPLSVRRKLYRPFDTDKGKKSRQSSYTVEAKRRGFTGSLQEKAKAASEYYGGKIPVSVLKTVRDRGMAAWASGGHRAGQTPHSWGIARVNSFLVGGKTFFTTDFDQVRKLPQQVSVAISSESKYAPNLSALWG